MFETITGESWVRLCCRFSSYEKTGKQRQTDKAAYFIRWHLLSFMLLPTHAEWFYSPRSVWPSAIISNWRNFRRHAVVVHVFTSFIFSILHPVCSHHVTMPTGLVMSILTILLVSSGLEPWVGLRSLIFKPCATLHGFSIVVIYF